MTTVPGSKPTKTIGRINLALALPALVFVGFGARHALHGSPDLQWSGSHVLAAGKDPYLQYLRHDPDHQFLLAQVPNYLHELYILMLPLGLLQFGTAKIVWIAVNLLLTLACVVLAGRAYQLDRSKVILLGLLLAVSTPFRVMLGNGQQSMLELLFLLLILALPRIGGIFLGLSYFKYSFSPVFFLYFLFRSRWRLLLQSLVLPAIGLILFWLIVRGNPLRVAIEPLAVGRSGVTDGLGDVMHLTTRALLPFGGGLAAAGGPLAALIASAVLAWVVARRRVLDESLAFAALVPASLLVLVHLSYDYVALMVPLAATLATHLYSVTRKRVSYAVLFLLWFVVPEADRLRLGVPAPTMEIIVCLLLLVLFFCHLPSNHAGLQAQAD